ncbi:hypothetical protein F0562_029968 [Nyssa sinensis]|uniref:DUF4378 domain-containing protein n=1 Tax=Nyssa sinensis TaxID=561372 RepID=A0A5J5AUZ1_9ASTE|nr:hypothetical protein F0562_029968 [Nyssa sinensis]
MKNMPQDSLRSVVYRSFVTCDDPKGVVECRTFRKSKTNSHKMEGRVENHRTQRNLNASSTYKEERKEMTSKGIADSPSSFQLVEVSKGAQKLNRVIDSWSMGMTFDGESKDIAKDLLKGAIDLQESLIMLGKLQEASRYVAKLKKKQEKSRGGRIDEMGSERTNSNQFGDQNYCTGIQKPRLSADGCSRDCYEELRRVIRDSLARQNLLPDHSNREKAYCDRRASDADRDIPSTSSSQSSLVCSCRFAPPESSLSSKAPQKKPNGPNLVAKLMGLEEITSKSLQSTHKQLECDKISNQRRPIFDIDMPKARKSNCVGQKVDPERRTLKEILDNMQFKGLLKCNSVENFKPPSYHSKASHSKNRSIDNEIPIVLLKPLSYSCLEEEEPCTQMFVREEGALDTRDVLRKLRTKEELSPKTIECGERVLCSNEMCRNDKADKPPMKRFSQEEEVKDCKEVVAETVVKTKEKMSSNKKRASVPIKNKAQKEAIDKKVDKVQKMVQNRRKPEEIENLKSKGASVSHNQVKVTSSKPRNPEKGSNIVKNRFAQPKSITSNPISKSTTPTTSHSSSDQKKNLKNTTRNISHKSADQKKNHKNEKQVKEPVAAKFAIETMACEDDNKGISIMCENESDLIRTDTVSVDQLLLKEEPESTDASEIQIKDHCIDTQNSLCEVTLQTIPHESSIKSDEAANYCISHDSTERNLFNTKTNPRDFLLCSPLFLNHAEELFNINTNQSIFSQKVSVNDSRIADTRLLLDCANELMELKSLQCTRTVHTILHAPVRYSRICISLYQLVDALCDGIENLKSYGKLVGKNLPIDRVSAILQRDLSCNGVGSGAWDLGWRKGFTVDEIEQVVVGIEKLVLGCLIEEVLTDFFL